MINYWAKRDCGDGNMVCLDEIILSIETLCIIFNIVASMPQADESTNIVYVLILN